MASTAEGAALTVAHRLDQLRLRTVTVRDLLRMWGVFDPADISRSWSILEPALMLLVLARQPLSVRLSTQYLEDFRRAERVPGSAPRITPTRLTRDDIVPNLRIVGPGNAQRMLAQGRRPSEIARVTLVNVEGEVTRQTLNGGRDTLVNTVRNDPKAIGYYRVTDGQPCSFCALLAGRGAVYNSDESGSFHAHRKCACTAEPLYDIDSARTPSAKKWRALYDESAAAVPRSTDDWSAEVRREFRRRYERSLI